MIKLYYIQASIQMGVVLRSHDFLAGDLAGNHVDEIRPGVFRIEDEFGSEIWYQNLDEAKKSTKDFLTNQIKFLSEQLLKVEKFNG